MRSRLLILCMIGGVFCITTGLYALRARYPTTFRIPAFLTTSTSTTASISTAATTSTIWSTSKSQATPTLNHTMTTLPPASLSQFLADNKRRFLEDVKKDAAANWTIVIGNSAGGMKNLFPRHYRFNFFPRQTLIVQRLPSPILF